MIQKATLEELYKQASGNLSKFLFLDDYEKSSLTELVREDYIKYVKNNNNRPMYVIRLKLVEEVAGRLEKGDLRLKQAQNFLNPKEEEND